MQSIAAHEKREDHRAGGNAVLSGGTESAGGTGGRGWDSDPDSGLGAPAALPAEARSWASSRCTFGVLVLINDQGRLVSKNSSGVTLYPGD